MKTFIIISYRYRRLYNKHAKHYSVYAMKTAKSYAYIPDLQTMFVRSRLEAGSGMPRGRSLRPDDPRRLGLLPPVPPQPMEELVRTQVSRGQGKINYIISSHKEI